MKTVGDKIIGAKTSFKKGNHMSGKGPQIDMYMYMYIYIYMYVCIYVYFIELSMHILILFFLDPALYKALMLALGYCREKGKETFSPFYFIYIFFS